MHLFVIRLRNVTAVLVLLLGLVPATGLARDFAIDTTPIPLNTEQPDQTTVGRLTYLGGLVLKSKAWRFGGLSSLVITTDGRQLLSVSDRGTWVAFDPVLKNGRLVGVDHAKIRFMANRNGRKWGQGETDSEGLTIMGNTIFVSFERDHRIMRYALPNPNDLTSVMMQRARPGPHIDGLDKAPSNLGLESITTLGPNRFLTVTEGLRTDDNNLRGWLVVGDKAERLAYHTSDGYVPTDMALLPNGDVLTVERYFNIFTGPKARLCIIDGTTIVPGAVLDCDRIAELAPPLSVDNMEGLAVHTNAAGQTILYLVSDNNFSWNQRTLLMMFRLDGDSPGPVTARASPPPR